MSKELLTKIEDLKLEQNKSWDSLVYGMGDLYQSFVSLGIKGKRSTEERIIEYELLKYLNKSSNIIDIGCNVGFIDLQIAPYVNSTTGVEINPHLSAISNAVKNHLNQTNSTFVASGFENYVSDKKFDGIFSFAADEVADGLSKLNFDEYIEKLDNMLNEKGYIFFEFQASDMLKNTWKPKYDKLLSRFNLVKEKKIYSTYPVNVKERIFLILQKK